MEMRLEEFLKEAGLDEGLQPGEIKYVRQRKPNPANCYTVVFDWKHDPDKIRIEVRPGLSGKMPEKSEMSRYALSLQAPTYIEIPVKETAH